MSDGKGGGAFYGALVLVGAVVGIGILGAIRYSRPVEETHVHYHANWAVFVDGQRLDLSGNEYMEDVFQCMADPSSQTPETRIHMHENNQDVVHVHDSGTTWDHLLANLGFGIGHDYFDSGKMRLQNDGTRTLKFVLNGRLVTSVRDVPRQRSKCATRSGSSHAPRKLEVRKGAGNVPAPFLTSGPPAEQRLETFHATARLAWKPAAASAAAAGAASRALYHEL